MGAITDLDICCRDRTLVSRFEPGRCQRDVLRPDIDVRRNKGCRVGGKFVCRTQVHIADAGDNAGQRSIAARFHRHRTAGFEDGGGNNVGTRDDGKAAPAFYGRRIEQGNIAGSDGYFSLGREIARNLKRACCTKVGVAGYATRNHPDITRGYERKCAWQECAIGIEHTKGLYVASHRNTCVQIAGKGRNRCRAYNACRARNDPLARCIAGDGRRFAR